MRIIYDDLVEAAEIAIRCNNTVMEDKCIWCPFYNRCMVDSLETRCVLCGEVEPPKGVE